MGILLRTATQDDSERIANIYLISRKFFLPYAPVGQTDDSVRSWIRDRLVPTGDVTVAVIDGSPIGFLAVSRGEFYGWIDHLYLDPSTVGLGIGSSLLTEAKTHLAGPIRLYTFQANEGARRFYRRHGFREIELSDGASNEEKTPDVLMEWP
jgi:ribosomal protein S18 acetylase RimI-like enzyme